MSKPVSNTKHDHPEIPLSLVRFSQLLSLILVLAAIVLRMPVLIYVLWILTSLTMMFGPKANLFVWLGKLFLGGRNRSGETQHVELLRFNTSIAVILLCLSTAAFLLHWPLAGYIIAGILGIAQLAALFGFCFGCFLYYQIKQRTRRA